MVMARKQQFHNNILLNRTLEDLRILLVDDDEDFGDFAVRLIEGFGCQIKRCINADQGLEQLRSEAHYNLLITDIYMKPVNGLELINRVREEDRFLPILVLSGLGDIRFAVECIKAGALDYIEKTADESVLYGKLYNFIQKWQEIQVHTLTPREKEILHFILDGYSNRDIAELTERSIRTVEDHRRRMMEKLGAKNQIDLVKTALNYK